MVDDKFINIKGISENACQNIIIHDTPVSGTWVVESCVNLPFGFEITNGDFLILNNEDKVNLQAFEHIYSYLELDDKTDIDGVSVSTNTSTCVTVNNPNEINDCVTIKNY